VSNTSNFDYCVQLGLAPLKAIFHLALKNEEMFPHNLPPMSRDFGGHPATVYVRLLDDETAPADVGFEPGDNKALRFFLPVEITVETPDAPDPALTRITLSSTISVPGTLATWPVGGEDQLGIDFADVTVGDVEVPALAGLPVLDSARFLAAIHTKYMNLPQRQFTHNNPSDPDSPNILTIYDGTRDPTLIPPNKTGNPEITAALESHGGKDWLKVILPIHATVPQAANYAQHGIITFWREVVEEPGTVRVNMATEPDTSQPGLAGLATVIDFDGSSPFESLIVTNLLPLFKQKLALFGVIAEPWFDEAAAKALIAEETAAYLRPRKYPYYTPRSGDPDHPLSTPVGFTLPDAEALAILMNRQAGTTEADDHPPDAFIGDKQVAMAASRQVLDKTIADAIEAEFPNLDTEDGHLVSTDEGEATLKSLSVTPSDAGTHDIGEGHLWVEGMAEVHIDCWFDPDVEFDGAILLRLDVVETETECSGTFRAEMRDFDAGQSCCDVFIDLIIPVVGWIMLAVVESMIDKVGGELAEDIGEQQSAQLQPIPPVVVGVAELQACLEAVSVSTQGLVLPGHLRIRRDGTSFEDLSATGDLPRP
jgi:hypothetical protein